MRWVVGRSDRGLMFNQSMFAQRIAQVVVGALKVSGVDGSMDERTLGSEGNAVSMQVWSCMSGRSTRITGRPTNRVSYASSLNHNSHI